MNQAKSAKVIAVLEDCDMAKIEAEDGFQYMIRKKDFPSDFEKLTEGMTLDILIDPMSRVLKIGSIFDF
jgi:hypothetical protein